MGPNQLERFLSALRRSHPDMEHIFLNGSCFYLWDIVRTVFPEVEPWYSQVEGHIYLKYKDRFYDILGKHCAVPKDIAPFDYKEFKPHKWSM